MPLAVIVSCFFSSSLLIFSNRALWAFTSLSCASRSASDTSTCELDRVQDTVEASPTIMGTVMFFSTVSTDATGIKSAVS